MSSIRLERVYPMVEGIEYSEYDIVTSTSRPEMLKTVNERLKTGWMLYGSLTVTENPSGRWPQQSRYHQAMVKLA